MIFIPQTAFKGSSILKLSLFWDKNWWNECFLCGFVFFTLDFSSWACCCLSQWWTASCVFVHYSILLPFDCIARVPSWCECMQSVRSTAVAAVAPRAIVSQIGGFMIKISSLLFWWALMSPVCFEQPRMKLADNEERLNGVGFLSNLWVNKYCFLPIISSCLLVSLFAFILSKSGMVHPLTPSDLLTREYSHKPIKQTQDTRTRTTRVSTLEVGLMMAFFRGLRHESDPAETARLFVRDSKWLMIHSSPLQHRETLACQVWLEWRDKRERRATRYENGPQCCLKPPRAR